MIYIDTGPFLARYIEGDQHHAQAIKLWDKIKVKNLKYSTSNFVLDEAFTLLARRAGYAFAAARARNIYASEKLTIFRPDSEDELEAIHLFEKYSDQKISFTDCISFALIRRENIDTVFSFDKHFERLGAKLFNG